MFDCYEVYDYELSVEELSMFASEWEELDEFEQGFYDDFEDYCEARVHDMCYGDGD